METAAPRDSAAGPPPASEAANPGMGTDPFAALRRPGPRRVIALVVPALLGLALAPARDSIDIAVVVLIFTLLVVAIAALGDRVAGLLASVSSAAWMDFFLIPPHFTFRIARGEDIVLAVLFAVVGLAVTELALRARRQAAEVARRGGYVDGVLEVLRIAPDQGSGQDRRAAICREITRVLDIDNCSYAAGAPAGGWPVLHDTGEITQDGRHLDIVGAGLPTNSVIAIPVRHGGQVVGHFRLVASTRIMHPSADQLKVAVLLAEQAAIA